MPLIRTVFCLVFIVCLISACSSGGGGGGPDYSINLSQSSVNAQVNIGGSSTASVIATYTGDGVVVGYPPGVAEVSWLTVDVLNQISAQVVIELTLNSGGFSPGIYTTTLRVVTGKADGSAVRYEDLSITMTVQDGLRFATHPNLKFQSKAGLPAAPQAIEINALSDWRLQVFGSSTYDNWLTFSQSEGSAEGGNVSVLVNAAGQPEGYHSATLILTDAAGNQVDSLSVDLTVTGAPYLNAEPDKSITTSAGAAELTWDIQLTSDYGANGSSLTWTATSDQAWLIINNTNGDLNGNQVIQAFLDPEALLHLANGAHTTNVTVQFSSPALNPLSVQLNLDLQLTPTLTLAEPVVFMVDSTSEEAAVSVSVAVVGDVGSAFAPHIGAISWQAQTDHQWLTVETPNGDLTDNSELILALDRAALTTLANGEHEASVTLTPSAPRFASAMVPVSLQLALPSLAAVGPYVVFSGEQNPLILQGSGFISDHSHTVAIGDVTLSAEFVNQTQLSLQLPINVAAGEYTVTVINSLGIERPNVRLLVKDTPSYSTAAMTVPKPFRNITLDPERQAVLLTGGPTNELYRLLLDDQGQWQNDSLPMANLQSATLTRDGTELLVAVASTEINDRVVRLNADTLAIIDSSHSPSEHDFYGSFDLLLPLLDGSTFVFDSSQFGIALSYPDWLHLDAGPSVHYSQAFMSRDRTRFLLGGNNSAVETYSYDLSGGTFVHHPALLESYFRTHNVAMSGNASRIVAYSSIYDSDYQLLGSLSPIDGIDGVAVSPDGTSAFVKRYINDQTQLFHYDISAAAGPYTANPEPLEFVLAEGEYIVDMEVSTDGKALFILCAKFESGYTGPTGSVFYIHPLAN